MTETETETKFQNLINFNTFYNSASKNSDDPDARSDVAYETSIQNEIKKMSKDELATKILEIESVLKDAKPPNKEVEPPPNFLQKIKNKFTNSPSVAAAPAKDELAIFERDKSELVNFLKKLKEAEKAEKIKQTATQVANEAIQTAIKAATKKGGRRKPRKSKRNRKSKRSRKY